MLVGLTKRLALGSILLTTTTALFVTVILAVSAPTVWAAEQVDLLLVLAADVSYSIAGEQFKLQREGYAQAITNPRVIRVIQSGEIGRIGICYIEWSGEIFQTVVADWTLIGSVRDARQFANRIVEAPRSSIENTSISTAILFATAQIERAPFRSQNRIIDISGDGDNNAGRSATSARDEAVAKGVTINGLAILNDDMKEHTHPPGGLMALGGMFLLMFCLDTAAQDAGPAQYGTTQEGCYGVGHNKWHRDFYASLRRNDGQGPCCSLTDCRPTQSRMVGDHYEVKLDGEWMQVPNWTIINVVAFHTNVNWLASIRGRLGYVWGPGMIYATGGGAWANVDFDAGGPGNDFALTSTSTKSGWTVGAGYEWLINPNWSLRGEYLYYKFTDVANATVAGGGILPGTFTTHSLGDMSINVFRVAVNYKFDWWRDLSEWAIAERTGGTGSL
jgi:opacity protein-like surface antigen